QHIALGGTTDNEWLNHSKVGWMDKDQQTAREITEMCSRSSHNEVEAAITAVLRAAYARGRQDERERVKKFPGADCPREGLSKLKETGAKDGESTVTEPVYCDDCYGTERGEPDKYGYKKCTVELCPKHAMVEELAKALEQADKEASIAHDAIWSGEVASAAV